jgi:hypothetical protein
MEIGVGVICGCLPAFRSFVGYIFPSLKMTLAPTGKGGGAPAYPNRSKSNIKSGRALDASTGTFIELQDNHGSEDELHQKENEGASIFTQGSEIPITETLVPMAGKGYGNQTMVNVGELEAQSKDPNTIFMTKTVVQSHRRV